MSGKGTINFNDYIDELNLLNNFNSDISLNNNTYPNSSYKKLEKKRFKDLVYINVKARLLNIVANIFKWTLPDNFEERVVELGLITQGMICLYKGKNGTLILPCIPYNKYNVYGNPTQVNVLGWNGYHEVVNIEYGADITAQVFSELKIPEPTAEARGIICRDNKMAYPYIRYIFEYAKKITDKKIALDIATQRLKSPFIYIVNEMNMKDNMERMVEKIEDNEDIIFKIKSNKLSEFDEAVKPVSVNINPAIIQEIKGSINFDFNEFLETVGINTNPSPDKSQVVLTPELDSNDELVMLEKELRYKERQKFCKLAKQVLNVDIKCEYNDEQLKKEIEKTRKELTGGNTETITKKTKSSSI